MKYLVFLLLLLAACGQNSSDYMQKPGANAKKECPIYKKGHQLPIAKIVFEQQSLVLEAQEKSILAEVAEMHQRCGGVIVIEGYKLAQESENYGLLRAGVVFKELEKNRVPARFMEFNQKIGEKTDVVISLKM